MAPAFRHAQTELVDLYGFGHSPRPWCRYTVERHVDALARTLQAGPPRVLVGHSLGAALALALAARHPDRVQALCLFSLPDYGSRAGAIEWFASQRGGWVYTNMLATALACLVTRRVAGRWLPYLVRNVPAEVARDLVLHNMASSTTSLWEVLYQHDVRGDAAALPPDLPVTCVHGLRDATAPPARVTELAAFPALAPCDAGCRPSSVAARSGRLPWGNRRPLRSGAAGSRPRRADRVMAGREPVGIASARPGLAASAAVALAYGVVLPVLPTVVASSPSPARAIAELMAVYSAAMVVTAPIWVRVCRQLPAHLLVRFSLLGQAAAMIMLLWSSETTVLLLARGLQGIFAGAALPALQTAASRAAGSEGDRSQRLSDLTRAALVGSLFGPGVGGVVAADDSLVGPVLVGAAVLVLAAAAQRPATGSATIVVAGPGSPTRHRDVVVLLLLAALAAAAMSVYEVGLATQGGADGLSARELGFMFTGCGVVMLLAQSLVFRPRHDPLRAFNWVAPSFVATAAGLALLAWLGGRWPGALGLVLVAAGGGVLQPALVYWTSRAAGAAEATSLGWRASFTGAGQALGSLAGGFAFAVTLAGKIVLATLLLILLAAAMLALARRRAPAGLPLSVSTQER